MGSRHVTIQGLDMEVGFGKRTPDLEIQTGKGPVEVGYKVHGEFKLYRYGSEEFITKSLDDEENHCRWWKKGIVCGPSVGPGSEKERQRG